jgi:lysozyme
MNISQQGIDFLKRREGFVPRASPDAHGVSIGYGCFLSKGTADYAKYINATITEAQAHDLMMERLGSIVPVINSKVKVPLAQHEFDALASFCYNTGTGPAGFGGSTLLKMLNQGKRSLAAAQFAAWRYSQGKVNEGLVTRRKFETALFKDGAYG